MPSPGLEDWETTIMTVPNTGLNLGPPEINIASSTPLQHIAGTTIPGLESAEITEPVMNDDINNEAFQDAIKAVTESMNLIPKAKPRNKELSLADVDLSALWSYSEGNQDLARHAMDVLLSRIQDMVNVVLPEEVQVSINWKDESSKGSIQGQIEVKLGDTGMPSFEDLIEEIERLNKSMQELVKNKDDSKKRIVDVLKENIGLLKENESFREQLSPEEIENDENIPRRIEV